MCSLSTARCGAGERSYTQNDDADCEDSQQNGEDQQHRALLGSSVRCSNMALRSYVLYLNALWTAALRATMVFRVSSEADERRRVGGSERLGRASGSVASGFERTIISRMADHLGSWKLSDF